MCDACLKRARNVNALAARFARLAAQDPDPARAAHLARSAAELEALAADLSTGCAATGDVVWIEPEEADAPHSTPAGAAAR